MNARETMKDAKLAVGKTVALARRSAKSGMAEFRSAATSTGRLAKDHPVTTAASVGVLLGAGVLAGVAAHRALGHKPTVGEAVMGALRGGAKDVSKRVSKAAKRARK